MVTRWVAGLFLEAGGPCLSESSSELGLLEKIARPLLASQCYRRCSHYCRFTVPSLLLRVQNGHSRNRIVPLRVQNGRTRNRIASLRVQNGHPRNRIAPLRVQNGRTRNRIAPIRVQNGRPRNQIAPILIPESSRMESDGSVIDPDDLFLNQDVLILYPFSRREPLCATESALMSGPVRLHFEQLRHRDAYEPLSCHFLEKFFEVFKEKFFEMRFRQDVVEYYHSAFAAESLHSLNV